MTAMKQETANTLVYLNINKIKTDLVDFRDRKEEYADRGSEEFEYLKNSIKDFGIATPLQIVETEKGYQLVDGRRRLLASKQIGLKEVPVILIRNETHRENLAVVTLIANIHRKDLNDSEKARGILKLFEMNGFDKTESKHNVKALHDGRPMRNQKFENIFNSIGWSAMYVYKLLQTVCDLSPDILDLAEEKGLPLVKKVLITHTGLKGHEPMQKRLIKDIANKPIKEAREITHQLVSDLKKGVITKTDSGSYLGGWRDKEDTEKPEIVKHPFLFFTESNVKATELLRLLTGHDLSRGEIEYTQKHIENTKQHRKDMVAAMGEIGIRQFIPKLLVLQTAIMDLVEEYQRRYS